MLVGNWWFKDRWTRRLLRTKKNHELVNLTALFFQLYRLNPRKLFLQCYIWNFGQFGSNLFTLCDMYVVLKIFRNFSLDVEPDRYHFGIFCLLGQFWKTTHSLRLALVYHDFYQFYQPIQSLRNLLYFVIFVLSK